jgi:glutamine amidotransferase
MCRWLTYCGDPIYLDHVIFEKENSLIQQSLRARQSHVTTNGDGFGIGWYAERPEPGTYRDILPAWNDANLRSIAHQIRSGLFLAHVRASTGTATSRANCHPFSHGKWLFMHNGQIGGYERIRRRLESLVDDGYYVHRLGTTDSELIFYLMLSFGLADDPMYAMQRALAAVTGIMEETGVLEPLRFTAVVTDGQVIYAIRHATDETPPSLYWRYEGGQLLVVSEPLDDDQRGWHEVPAGQMLVTERNTRVDMVPFLPA